MIGFSTSATIESFEWAIMVLKQGGKVTRKGFNGKNMWIVAQHPDKNSLMSHSYLVIHLDKNKRSPWIPTPTDIFSDDWMIVDEKKECPNCGSAKSAGSVGNTGGSEGSMGYV